MNVGYLVSVDVLIPPPFILAGKRNLSFATISVSKFTPVADCTASIMQQSTCLEIYAVSLGVHVLSQ